VRQASCAIQPLVLWRGLPLVSKRPGELGQIQQIRPFHLTQINANDPEDRACLTHKATSGRNAGMNDMTQQWEAMQRMMRPGSDALQDNVRCFWNIQGKLLDIMENFADGWFERRHVGRHAALEAAQHMCNARTGVDLARGYQVG
jgi:hypothetical protein